MKLLTSLSFIFFTTLITLSLAQNSTNNSSASADQPFDKNVDHYSFKTTITDEAQHGFMIEYKNYYKVVTNMLNSKRYCLVGFDQDRPEECAIETTVRVPVQTFSILPDSYDVVPFVELLGLQNNVTKTATANMTSPCIKDGSTDVSIVSPEITFSSLANVGGTYIAFSANDDTLAPLQKASWILYLGAFFDLEIKAFSIYNQISNNYNCHKDNILNSISSSRKGVSWTTYLPDNRLYIVHSDIYYSQLVHDAGGHLEATNVAQEDTFQANVTVKQLALANALHGAEFIIDTSSSDVDYTTWLNGNAHYFTDDNSVESRIQQVPAIVNHKVYTINGLINNNRIADWTQRATARPDLALLDLIKLLYPSFKVASDSTFPVWLVSYDKLNETQRYMNSEIYGGCSDIASNAFAQSQCTLGASSHSDYIEPLSKGDKAGISVGTVVFVIIVTIGGIWLFRGYRRNKRKHQFYRMNEM
ncbi:MAG: hypothetical protein EXX96DRAFT_544373 [Benjaminiella poitrasii]|nr:MAG: hypothetical protein EXX96DRAFT_544373 [Benjaminiella poitrasii]